MKYVSLVLGLLLYCTLFCAAQPKSLMAVKTAARFQIDGALSEPDWQSAPVAIGFVQSYPALGQPGARTEVRVLYGNDAIYVGARLYDDPSLIRRQLTARDEEAQKDVDYFSVFFDTYNDQQNAFEFLVTSANVQTDTRLGANTNAGFGSGGDRTWDAVWASRTQFVADGWVVEMRIPYLSLRFAKKEVQTWGIQFGRLVRRTNEMSYWNPVDPNVAGFANQFGKLQDLQNIEPPLRLSFSPYVTAGKRYNPEVGAKPKETLFNGGADVKWGVNESFTLDATLIPDYGQVISDNVVNNLTAYEQQFRENRPFFTEGTELFNKSGLFYSRRIGAIPGGYSRVQRFIGQRPEYGIIANPSITQLYNATKFSGRTPKKLGIGVFNAITAPMEARLENINTNKDTVIQTEPLTNYNIVVLDQALRGRSFVTLTNTNVLRQGAGRDANVSALDWALYDKRNRYAVSGTARYSKIFGQTPINSLPVFFKDTLREAGQLVLVPYDGFASRLRFAKVSGNLRFNAQVNLESDTYDPNDLGILFAANEVQYRGSISWNQVKPTQNFINYSYSLAGTLTHLYKPYTYGNFEIQANGFWIFKNFWDARISVGGNPRPQKDYFDLRTPGAVLERPASWYLVAGGSTDSRKRLYVSYNLFTGNSSFKKSNFFQIDLGARYRFSNRFTLEVEASRQHDKLDMGYAFRRESNRTPIAGYRDYKTLSTTFSGIYNFTPRMNLTFRSRHYWNGVGYLSFFNTNEAGTHIPRPFINGADENVNFYNLDAFFTWDFRLGSRIIAGWKNRLSNDVEIDGSEHKGYLRNFNQVLQMPHGNELTLKVIYFLDYNQLRKKR